MKRIKLIMSIISLMLILNIQTYHIYASTSSEVFVLVERTEKKIIETFTVLSEAEDAGADVSLIMKNLSKILDDLNEAKYGLNNEASELYPNEIQSYLDSVNEMHLESIQLKNTSVALQQETIRSRLYYTALEVTFFVLLMYGFWFYFKSYRAKELMQYKPGVA